MQTRWRWSRLKINITARHVPITGDIQSIINQKLDRCTRILGKSALSAQVVVSRRPRGYTIELMVHARGDHVLRGEGIGATWAQATGLAVDKVEQQAHTLKGKWEDRRRRAVSDAEGRVPS